MYEFKMPALGADIESAKLIEWKVKPGDRMKKGDIVAIIETTKSVLDAEIWQDGIIDQILVQPSEEDIPVGTVLAILRTEEGEKISPAPQVREATAQPRAAISPAARKRIQEFHLDAGQIKGTGPHGAITLEDVEKAIAAQTPSAAAQPSTAQVADKKLLMRQTIAAAMERSHREIPHYYLETQIDLSRALTWMEAENQKRPPEQRLLPVALFLKAVALGLKKFPEFNGFYKNGAFQPSPSIHVGVVIFLRDGGLMVPAIHDADQKSLVELMAALQDLVHRTRTGGLKSSEISDPTITVTNLGDEGVEKVFGVIYPPQVALLGFGKILETPVVEEGKVVVRRAVTITLAGDHRVSDGHRGSLFLSAVNGLLQEVEKL